MNTGLAEWKRRFLRVTEMDRAEMVDRIRQHAGARLDLARYKLGADFAPRLRSNVPARPRFFFAPEAIPGLCSRLSRLFPATAEEIIARAERICNHRFDLLGFKDLEYGSEIDWHCDRVHGKRAPRKPWFHIHYLDFAEVGDSKITWEINRHQHLVTLAKAFRLTGDEKFAQELFRQWEHWRRENPYPIGINWASSLEVGVRSLSWLWVWFLLSQSPVVPAGFHEALLRSLAISGRHIERYLSTYFSPNTHLLGEGVALFFIGTLCPEIPSARHWQERGWKIVLKEAERQVRSDGLHFEQTIYYHVYALDFFLHAAVLASVNQIATPSQFDRALERMLEALSVLGGDGALPQLGDDDGGRLFDPSRNRMQHLLDPLATGAVLFGRGDFKTVAGGPREETLWLLGESGIEEFNRIPVVKPARESVAFEASGLYVMAVNAPEQKLIIDAGPQGSGTAGHGHADALSLTISSAGRDWLVDSGTLEYVGADTQRDYFRGTQAHNTLLVAGKDQAEPNGPFRWGRVPTVKAEAWIVGRNFDLFIASHDGYSRLPNPVVHRRTVFSLKPGFWLVRDQALGSGEQQLDLFWHIAPALQAVGGQENVFLGEDGGLQFVTDENSQWAESIKQLPGSPVYGVKENHSVLHFSARAQLPAEFVTLLVPMADAAPFEHKLARIASSTSLPVVGYRYKTVHAEHCLFFGEGRPWKLDGWGSDAQILYWKRTSNGSAEFLICCHATYVDRNEQRIITAKRPVMQCEIFGSAHKFDIVSSDSDAIAVNGEGWEELAEAGTRQLAGKITSRES